MDRNFLYSLADNFIGYEDGVTTPGERAGAGLNALASMLIENPLGVAGNAIAGAKDELDEMMFRGGAMRSPENVLLAVAGAGLPMKAPKGALRSGAARKALTKAEAQAQEVIDLLKEGRASEVTDEMLAAADDMYLYNNYDLPMDEASRMARAQEMGFGGDMYHGSNASFDGFDPRALDATGQKVMAHGDGTYLSERPKSASRYAERRDGGVMYPVRENMDKPWTGEMSVSDLSPQDAKIYMEAESGPEALGFSGRRNSLGMSVVPDPSNIRSRFARFDPRLKHLSNLSAGVAGAAVLSEGDFINQIEEYLAGVE
jgi:hypothetical protein